MYIVLNPIAYGSAGKNLMNGKRIEPLIFLEEMEGIRRYIKMITNEIQIQRKKIKNEFNSYDRKSYFIPTIQLILFSMDYFAKLKFVLLLLWSTVMSKAPIKVLERKKFNIWTFQTPHQN